MKPGVLYARTLYKHVVPFAVAVRLITLSTSGSLAVAATRLPAVDGRLPITSLLPTLPSAPIITATDFLTQTNAARVSLGFAPLKLNEELDNAAQNKIDDMIANNYWDHFRPSDHKAPWDFIKDAGYTYHYAGENLARGFTSAESITQAWLASPAHRANLLSPNYTDVGFATGMGFNDQGQKVLLTVQLFGAR